MDKFGVLPSSGESKNIILLFLYKVKSIDFKELTHIPVFQHARPSPAAVGSGRAARRTAELAGWLTGRTAEVTFDLSACRGLGSSL